MFSVVTRIGVLINVQRFNSKDVALVVARNSNADEVMVIRCEKTIIYHA